jgi:hypothetical protein
MLLALRVVCALAMAVWLGAMLFFSAGVAPVAFRTMPSRELAGNMVNGAMHVLQTLAYGAGGVALVGYLLRLALAPLERRLTAVKAGLVALMLGLSLYAGFAVAAPMAEIRARLHTLDALPATDPERERFDRLHQLSVSLMGANLLLAIAVIGLEQARAKAQA